jgi:hypothetical protein
MADKYPTANGNWSTAANWNGGTKPIAGDDVYADGKTITIDEDTASLLSLNTTARSGGTAGGSFNITATRTVTATTINPGSAHALVISAGAGQTVTINGSNLYGSSTTNSIYGINLTGACTLNLNINLNGASGNTNRTCVQVAAAATIVITGDLIGSLANALVVASGASPSITVTGDLTGGTSGAGINIASGGSATVTITGNLLGGGNPAFTCASAGGCTLDITGNVTAGTVQGILFSAASTSSISVVGTCTASSTASAINQASATVTAEVTGPLVNVSNRQAVLVSILHLESDNPITWTFTKADGTTDRTLYTADAFTDFPAVGDVRSGTTYSNGGALTGTLAVPPAGAVALGVAVDAAVGTLALSGANVFRLGR